MESLKHEYAKNTLARWIRAQMTADRWETLTEYPVCIDRENSLLGVDRWDGAVPSYQECINRGLLPLVIFDVALLCDGTLHTGYEVIHTNDISDEKTAYLNRITKAARLGFKVWRAKAAWILAQTARPEIPYGE